jgi:hypothetical protein
VIGYTKELSNATVINHGPFLMRIDTAGTITWEAQPNSDLSVHIEQIAVHSLFSDHVSPIFNLVID